MMRTNDGMDLQLADYINQIAENLPEIPDETNYWLVRTQGGLYYDTFRRNNFIAIGHEKITAGYIRRLQAKYSQDAKQVYKELRSFTKKQYPDETRIGLIANQIHKFVYDFKAGDIVIIPTESSHFVSFGIIQSENLEIVSEKEISDTQCEYTKRKKVKWIKDVSRFKLDPYLTGLFQAHQAINNLKAYSDYIDRTVNNFYIRKDEANLILEVQQSEDIRAKDVFGLGLELFNIVQSYSDENNLDLRLDEVELKITLNSPGKIQLYSPSYKTILLAAVVIVAINGGGVKIEYKDFRFDMSTDGLIKNITDFLNNKADREALRLKDTFQNLDVENPYDVLESYEAAKSQVDKKG